MYTEGFKKTRTETLAGSSSFTDRSKQLAAALILLVAFNCGLILMRNYHLDNRWGIGDFGVVSVLNRDPSFFFLIWNLIPYGIALLLHREQPASEPPCC